MSTDDEKRLEEKLDQVIDALPIIYALGDLLVTRGEVNRTRGLNKNTIAQNDGIATFEPVGIRKTLIEIKDITVLRKKRKR